VREGKRFPKAKLLSVSQKLLGEWLPQLDIGKEDGTEQEKTVRQQFIDVVAGKTVLAREADVKGKGKNVVEAQGFAPWSLCYAGASFCSLLFLRLKLTFLLFPLFQVINSAHSPVNLATVAPSPSFLLPPLNPSPPPPVSAPSSFN
jgi:hypothetical protein